MSKLIIVLLLMGPAATPQTLPTPTKPAATPAAPPAPPLTEAERLLRAKKTIEQDREELAKLDAILTNPKSEYVQAEAAYRTHDANLAAFRQVLAEHAEVGEAPTEDEKKKLAELEKTAKEARDRFDLAIHERRTLLEKRTLLELKIQKDEEALRQLTEVKPAAPAESQSNGPATTEPTAQVPGTPGPTAPAKPPPLLANPLQPTLPAATAPPTTVSTLPLPPAAKANLQRAETEARQREAAAQEARQRSGSLSERIDALRKNIAVETELLNAARQRSDAARAELTRIDEQIKQKIAAKAPEHEIQELLQRNAEADQRFNEARNASRTTQLRLNDLQEELGQVQAEQIAALQEAAEKGAAAASARKRLEDLRNPYTLPNILQWLLDHGLKMLIIALGMYILLQVVSLSSHRIVKVIANSSHRGSDEEKEKRAQTLVGVFRSTATFVIIVGSLLMLLDEAGIPIIPLLGGAAIFGLAVAFGAQSLIKDYFAGFMVLLEDQYGINDVVRIGSVSGLVEKITLRMTVIRDVEGALHFIPHGTIDRVTNMTHTWSRALFDIGVAYKERVDHVMEILLQLGRDLRDDPKFGPMILADPEMLGVDSFGESAIMIRFFIKTKPLMQWQVRRELLRRIKNRFDELGIEIPFPHRTLFLRSAVPNLTLSPVDAAEAAA
jgi:small conductance mechanosensitive channel